MRRNDSARRRRTALVPRIVFGTAFAAVVPAIAACDDHERHYGVAQQAFESTSAGGSLESVDAGAGEASESAAAAIDGGPEAETIDAGLVTPYANGQPPIPLPVAYVGFADVPPPLAPGAITNDAGQRARRRR